VLQTDKDFVEIVFFSGVTSSPDKQDSALAKLFSARNMQKTICNLLKFTKILSDLHMIVILIVYTGKKLKEEYDDENQAQ